MNEHASSRTLFFGRRWDAPIVDYAQQVETPVGQPCLFCGEPVEQGDRGFIRAAFDSDGEGGLTPRAVPVHAECDLRGIFGHGVGVCPCTGYDDSRASAKLVWQRLGEERGRDLAIRTEDLHRQEEPS